MESRAVVSEGGPPDGYGCQQEDRHRVYRPTFSQGDLAAVDDYLSNEFVNHDPPFGASADREGMRSAGATFRASFPDWHSTLHLLVAEGDLVAEVFTASGTHRGEKMGVAPTGREVSLRGINVFRVRDGRISERWGRLDDLGFLQQLGLAPAAGT
jgi:steroid delta-isomerase-like uncharacterized protein